MAARRTGARNSLGQDIDDMLADYCVANYGAPATQIIREAIREHISQRLDREPELLKRYDEARKQRLQIGRPTIVRFAPKDG